MIVFAFMPGPSCFDLVMIVLMSGTAIFFLSRINRAVARWIKRLDDPRQRTNSNSD
jgi:hypothetical protein